METVRLEKYLAAAGFGSRKEVKKLIKEGKVELNGEVVKDGATRVSPEVAKVTVDGAPVFYKEFVYLMLNKPAGYISATEDVKDQTVLDLVPEGFQHYELFPVGRLDKDTEGLLILTNDGKLAHDLLAPKKHVPKTYYAKVDGFLEEKHIDLFAQGIVLDDGYKTKPAVLKILSSGEISEVELTIHEGKFHQIKRMFVSIGMKVVYLKRISMGSVNLDSALNLGNLRELTLQELEQLKLQKLE